METLYVGLSAFGGALASGGLGWLRSNTLFEGRKCVASIIRAFIAGGATAGTYAVVGPPSFEAYIGAFMAGAGVDALGHRLSKK